jgi:hypothetical protein
MVRFGPLAVLCLLLHTPVFGSSLSFTSYGPGDTYNLGAGYLVGGFMSSVSGNMFTAGFTGNLAELDLAIGTNNAGSFVNIQIAADNGGLPGVVLESFTASVTNLVWSPGAYVSVVSTVHPLLSAGTSYWVLATTTTNNTDAWYWSNNGVLGTKYNSVVISGIATPTVYMNQTLAAFNVWEDPLAPGITPEPSTYVAGIALLGLVVARLRSR